LRSVLYFRMSSMIKVAVTSQIVSAERLKKHHPI